MKRLLPMLMTAGILASTPALAADHVVAGKNVSIDARIAHLETRQREGLATGKLTRTESRTFQREIDRLGTLYNEYVSDGMTKQEQRYLRYQVSEVQERMSEADGRSGYAAWDDGDRFGFNDRS